mgnify:CR=1 FL=1
MSMMIFASVCINPSLILSLCELSFIKALFVCVCVEMVATGTFIKLNDKLRPNSYLARSDVRDVARVESCTFICTEKKDDAGPTNNWAYAPEMMEKLKKMFSGCMHGRTMYIVPFLMGPLGSPYSKFGIEITDSPYVVVNMKIMTRMGSTVLNLLTEDKPFLVHFSLSLDIIDT